MKGITKDNKGITLISLIITVIIMLILVSVTTYTGLDVYKSSKVNKFVTQMQLIQTKVDDLVISKTESELQLLGEDINTISNATSVIEKANYNGEISTVDVNANIFRYFSEESLLENLDIEDVEDGIIINFTTREVISIIGVEYEGTTYYTQYKLPGGQTILNNTGTVTRDLSFILTELIDGLNATITISDIKITNGTLSYKEQNDKYWQTITNYTEKNKSYTIEISKSGNYIIRLQDNTNSENYIEKTLTLTLTNKPKTEIEVEKYNYTLNSENWAYAQKNGINYVWIPRFAYKTNKQTSTTDIKFIKGNSNIATDSTYINNEWEIHSKFTTNNKVELTGIWVSMKGVSETKVYNKDLNYMIELLNSDVETLIEI